MSLKNQNLNKTTGGSPAKKNLVKKMQKFTLPNKSGNAILNEDGKVCKKKINTAPCKNGKRLIKADRMFSDRELHGLKKKVEEATEKLRDSKRELSDCKDGVRQFLKNKRREFEKVGIIIEIDPDEEEEDEDSEEF